MTDIIYSPTVLNPAFMDNYIYKKIANLKSNHPSITDCKVEVIVEGKHSKNLCQIKLLTEWSKFVVSSNANNLKNAIDECTILLNYQLAVMLKI